MTPSLLLSTDHPHPDTDNAISISPAGPKTQAKPSPPAPASLDKALAAAKQRFTHRNPTSLALHRQSTLSLPGGNTRSLLHTSPFPVFLKAGSGYTLTSEDGHVYTDLMGEMTAGLYGHTHPLIQDALIRTVKDVGLNLGGNTTLEGRHAELLCKRYKLERVRFTNSGTEANLHAVQAAKRFTGRSKIVVFSGGYHGGCFTFVGDKPAANVVDIEDWIVAEYNDEEDARRKIEDVGGRNVAAVLIEGMQGQGPCFVGEHAFLNQVQESARKVGAVFILDEVQTSRLAPGGLQEMVGLQPDITTLGKFLGGGVAFGAFGGREDIMRVYDPREKSAMGHSGTFNNNTLGMAAGWTGLAQIFTPEVCVEFNKVGDTLRQKLLDLTKDTRITVTGLGTILGMHFLKDGTKGLRNWTDRHEEADLRRLFWLEMMEEGFWTTERGSLALILGTPVKELERFVRCVEGFLERYRDFVKI